MQSADFLSAVFFYLKVGENLNQNWIVENLNNAFSTWNGKLGELWGLVTTGPQTFKGGAVWSVMQTLHNGMVGIGYALVVLFFAISLCKNTMNFHELKRPEAAIHYFLRFVAAKALVGYGMDIMLNVFSICNGIVTDMADSMGGISEAMVSLPAEMQTAIENVGFLASIPLWLVTILGSLFITVLSFVMILTVYCDSDIESQSMRSGNSLEESIESKLMWEAIRKYLPKLELKECEVMIALYIDRLSVTDTAAKLRVDASTVRRRRDSACDKIRKAMEEK